MGNDQLALPSFLEHENDPRVLKYGLSYAHTHIKILEKEILRLKKLLDESKTKDEKQSQYFLNLNEKLSKFRDMLFGKKSEKRNLSDRYRKKLKKRILLEFRFTVFLNGLIYKNKLNACQNYLEGSSLSTV